MTRYPLGPAASRIHGHPASDGETLQTDVMRFMAILGLCLTAIFALVRTLPLSGVEEQAQTGMNPELQPEIAYLQKRVRNLQEKLQSARIESLRASRLIIEAQRRLPTDQHSSAKEENPPAKKPTHRREPVSRPVPAQDPGNGDPDAVSEEGYSLRFDSADALQQLIAKGSVVFFAMLDRKAWQLQMGGQGPEFVGTPFPRRFYEMSANTVPRVYQDLFNRVVPAERGDPPVWGVRLPGGTEAQIRTLVDGGIGGTLVISKDGDVTRRRVEWK